jgi:hypothetical protein
MPVNMGCVWLSTWLPQILGINCNFSTIAEKTSNDSRSGMRELSAMVNG